MQWAALADVIRLESEGSVRVHCSSNPDYGRPQIGGERNQELQNGSVGAGAVILLYTSVDKVLSYCIQECGVAVDANIRFSRPRWMIYHLKTFRRRLGVHRIVN